MRQLVPVVHAYVFGPERGVLVAHPFGNQCHGVFAGVVGDATFQVLSHTGQSFHPSIESRLILGPRRHSHLYAAQRGERLVEARHDNLAVESVEETLVEVSPELVGLVGVHVHAYEYLRSLKLLEGMLDAVGYVGGYAHLSLHLHVC